MPSDTVDVETCCAFQDEGPDADAPSSTTKITFAAPIKMSEKRVAVAGGASRWCGVFADDLASDIACALALPSSVVTIQGMEACVASGEIRSLVVVIHTQKTPIPGTLGPDAAALKLAEEWGMQGGGGDRPRRALERLRLQAARSDRPARDVPEVPHRRLPPPPHPLLVDALAPGLLPSVLGLTRHGRSSGLRGSEGPPHGSPQDPSPGRPPPASRRLSGLAVQVHRPLTAAG